MRFPSTLITWCSGSTRAPNRRTVCPATSTRPSPISSSQCLRLPTPASARTFCSRTPPGTSVRLSRSSSSSGYSSSSSTSRSGVLILDVLDVIGQERREVRQVLQAGQAQSLQEIPGGAVQDGTGLGVSAGFLDQATQHQGSHHAVAVDPADGRNPGPADRLAVGHHGQGLQRGLGQADLLAVADDPLDQRRAVLASVEPPAAGNFAQVKAAILGCVFLGEVCQLGRDLVPGPFEYLG